MHKSVNEIKLLEKVEKYFALTEKALKKIKVTDKNPKAAQDLKDLSERYFKDAQFFDQNGDKVNAYGALCYAHCFLDCGARLGLFDVDGDNTLFMVDGKK